MKKLLPFVMSFILVGVSSFCSESSSRTVHQEQRIYLAADAIKVSDLGVFITVDGELLPVPAVFSDKKGPYVKRNQLRRFPGCQSKRLHRCWCHNPNCPKPDRIFIAWKWRKYCSEMCAYEAQGMRR